MGHKIDLNLAEIVSLAERAESEDACLAILKEYWNLRVSDLFVINFNPDYQFILPAGKIPYTPSRFQVGEAVSLMAEMRTMRYFLSYKGKPMKEVPDVKRQALFIQILETITASEAELLCRLKEKSIGSAVLNLNVLKQIDPKLFGFEGNSIPIE